MQNKGYVLYIIPPVAGFFSLVFIFNNLTYSCRGVKIDSMKKLVSILILSCFTLFANVAIAYTERNTATLRVMNKAAGKVTQINVPVGGRNDFEKISITVRSCKQSDPFDAENFYAFVEIARAESAPIFSNWMNRNNPGANPVQDPDYDVWLVKCE